uniref:VWFD domain-containing protein n=1 Tax=Poecilia mexicana TaxID=48701 RepID=A0A3B3YA39_9TELE
GQTCTIRDGHLGCYDAMSTCTVWGDPHYVTFDGALAHFQGSCSYIITEMKVSFILNAGRKTSVVNGAEVSLPTTAGMFGQVMSTDFGLMVSYDMSSYVRITVPYTYQNSTCGLCGNFNNHPEDDFRTRQGQVVSSDVVFANSWKVSGDDEPGCDVQCSGLACAGCTAAQTALYRNSAHCGILENSTGPFAGCHQHLPPGSFVDSCVYDLCVGGGYQPILCQALNVYSSQCQQNGIQPQSWRRPGLCEIPCPANSHYEAQGTGCPSTCVNPNSTYNCPLPDQESCVCNSGYLLSGGVCVPHADCGCSFEGHYYRSGETVILDADCGRRCTCSYGSMTCSSHSCGQHESSHCVFLPVRLCHCYLSV